jgi:hypothetical protein
MGSWRRGKGRIVVENTFPGFAVLTTPTANPAILPRRIVTSKHWAGPNIRKLCCDVKSSALTY